MGRMHSLGKGISASAKPYKRPPPSWLDISYEDELLMVVRQVERRLEEVKHRMWEQRNQWLARMAYLEQRDNDFRIFVTSFDASMLNDLPPFPATTTTTTLVEQPAADSSRTFHHQFTTNFQEEIRARKLEELEHEMGIVEEEIKQWLVYEEHVDRIFRRIITRLDPSLLNNLPPSPFPAEFVEHSSPTQSE